MPKTPRTPHKRVKEPSTDLQRRIVEAVEEHYPEKELKDIADLPEVDCHPSSVTRTVKEFMAPEGDEYQTETDSGGGSVNEIGDLKLDVPESVRPEQYVRGYADGFEAGFDAALEWIERQSNISKGALQRESDDLTNGGILAFED